MTVWNRTRERADEHPAKAAGTPADAARGAEAVITIVVDAPQVEAVLFGPDGAAEGMDPGTLAIDMSTIAPTASRRIAERLAERGVRFLDAPVTGSSPKAEDGTLTIMVGGAAEDHERALPLFEAMGELVVHVGPHGHGSMAKLINNTAAATNAAAVAEALALARRTGLDTDALRRVMSAGSGASAMLELKAGPMLEGDFEPLFKLSHMLKDVRHCLAEAEAAGAPLRLAAEVERLYAEAEALGHGEDDFAAVIASIQRT